MAIIKHSEQRVGVFIDTQNLYHSAKNIYHARVNFGNVLKDAVAYVAPHPLARVRRHHRVGRGKGIFRRFGEDRCRDADQRPADIRGRRKKADWDVGLAVDAITASPKLDTVILLTGDGDFVPLVRYLQNHGGCQVEVVSFGRSSSLKLKEAADDFLDLDQDPRRYLLNYRPVRKGGNARAHSELHADPEASEIGKMTDVE